jgi:hypothetical protein
MTVGIFVEGPSDKTILLRAVNEFGVRGIPVRAGYGTHQGTALLREWRALSGRVREEKLVFVFDSDRKNDVEAELQSKPAPVPAKQIVLLTAPWKGIEAFTEAHLEGDALHEYDVQRQRGISKRVLAESFVGRISAAKLIQDPWLSEVLVPCIGCNCPPGSCIA